MAKIQINSVAREYLADALAEAGPIEKFVDISGAEETFLFAPIGIERDRLLNFDSGGITFQNSSDEELCEFINKFISDNMGDYQERYVIFHDPHAQIGDLSNLSDKPDNVIETKYGNLFIYIAHRIARDDVLDFRSYCVGYVKLIYILGYRNISRPFSYTQDALNFENGVFLCALTNCFDDESWLGATRARGTAR
jgi:hypothetical protein